MNSLIEYVDIEDGTALHLEAEDQILATEPWDDGTYRLVILRRNIPEVRMPSAEVVPLRRIK